VEVEVLLVANGAGTENSLLHVQGGGWESFLPGFFPWTVRGAVCGIVTLSNDEVGSTPVVVFTAEAQDGQDLGWRASMTIDGVRPVTIEGVPVRVPFWIALTAVVSAPTIVKITVSQGTAELAATAFAVRDPVPDAPPTS